MFNIRREKNKKKKIGIRSDLDPVPDPLSRKQIRIKMKRIRNTGFKNYIFRLKNKWNSPDSLFHETDPRIEIKMMTL